MSGIIRLFHFPFQHDIITLYRWGTAAATVGIHQLVPLPDALPTMEKGPSGAGSQKKRPSGFEPCLTTPPPTALSTAFPVRCASAKRYATEIVLNHATSDTICSVWRNSAAHGGCELSQSKILNFEM
jgi:hypothetical protein